MQTGQTGLVQWWLTPCQLADALPFQVPQLAVDTLKLNFGVFGIHSIYVFMQLLHRALEPPHSGQINIYIYIYTQYTVYVCFGTRNKMSLGWCPLLPIELLESDVTPRLPCSPGGLAAPHRIWPIYKPFPRDKGDAFPYCINKICININICL